MFRIKYYRRAWDAVIVLLAVVLAAMLVLWAGQTAGDEPTEPKMALVVSPWEGVFRASGDFSDEPFVEVGSHVMPETVVGLIDMDIMRPDRKIEVFAGVKGTVVQVLIEDGTFVEAGQALMVVQLDPPDT
jgi:biotin carboxyl carrier protein